ncbi:hypothetical protein MTF65_18410 [Streptomyces sp. APSN-46.1]|uniref:hypothetical protein n=1 Tax=Streptomyces sp. APSN-46.1 TaxID=2929049 RepID=UPI001FB3E76A|nr:hypothetical protein [Streptomyces sp. APSN-46.1]MCJ1679279.1 hypothetical protein [Streptomyces sp. APSN-46.1]
MAGRAEKFKQRATLSLVLTGIAAGVFFFVGSASQKPAGWGAAYAFATPVTVQLPSRCGVETFVRGDGRGTAVCERTVWTADGTAHTGTLYAYADEVKRDGGQLTFTGEAKALGDRAYGKPETWETVLHLATLAVAALGVLGLLLSCVAAAFPARRPRA